MKITTRSGAIYTVTNHGLWNKNGGFQQKVWSMHCIHNEDLMLFANREKYEELPIQVGKKMFISGSNEWWMSTPIVGIELGKGDERFAVSEHFGELDD